MSETAPLTLAFLERQPMAAARTLAALEPVEAAALLDHAPTRQITEVLAHAGPWSASRILQRMEPENAAAVLRAVDFRQAVAILRFAGTEEQDRLLRAAPTKLRRDFQSSLAYPEDTVGGHMTTKVLAMTGSHTVADALHEMGRAETREGDPHAVYVTDRQRKLLGVATAGVLLGQRPENSLDEIADGSIDQISARSRLSTVVHLEGWDRFPALPVISPRRHLLGALPRAALRRFAEVEEAEGLEAESSIPGAMAGAFLFSALELARLLIENPNVHEPVSGKDASP
jgi:magnesium transporter